MRGGTDADEVLAAEAQVGVALLRVVALDERELDAAGVEQVQELLRVGEAQVDVEFRVRGEEAGEGLDDGVFADGHRDAERELLDARGEARELGSEGALVVLERGEAAAQDLAGARERELLALVEEEADVVGGLEAADVLGDGGLGDVEAVRGLGVVHRFADGQEGPDAVVEHGGHVPFGNLVRELRLERGMPA